MKAPANPVSVKWSGVTPIGSFDANHPTRGRSRGITHDVFTREIIPTPGWRAERVRHCRYTGLILTAWTSGGTLAVRRCSPRQREKTIGGQPTAHDRLLI